jgi:predicted RNA-binding Zn ribbon-like protein
MGVMTSSRSSAATATGPAIHLADHRALDFVNTLATPGGAATEWIGDGQGLVAWMRGADLIDAADERSIRSAFDRNALDQAAREARTLRGWFRDLVTNQSGRLPQAAMQDAQRRLNAILKEDERLHLLGSEDGGRATHLSWQAQRLWRRPKSVLAPIAEEVARLLIEEDLSLVRQCGGEDCTIVFLDRTKAHKRRWCSMAACGNRAKVAAFRARAAD